MLFFWITNYFALFCFKCKRYDSNKSGKLGEGHLLVGET